MLRYYCYVTKLGEKLIKKSEDRLERQARMAKKVIKKVARRLDDMI